MKANASPISVADYCSAMQDKKIIVNSDYQRKDGLWNAPARSFFIESILLEYPIPKMFVYAKLDLKTRGVVKEIVDGQQRSQALMLFYENKLALSKNIETEELRGMKYNKLTDEWKTKFLSYQLPVDQFSGVPEDEVREAFRRMNANNVPLNAEEQRNARYQGDFKWFVNRTAENYKENLLALGLLSRRDLIRMTDLRLYAEIALTLDEGFVTVKGAQLDKLYRKYNADFDTAPVFEEKIAYGINFVIGNDVLHESVLLRMHVFQSIVMAVIALRYNEEYERQAHESFPEVSALVDQHGYTLEVLISALQEPEDFPALTNFIRSCSEATNTAGARAVRFLYFKKALSQLG
ncbi:DUF262 domain-containing protein [Pseudomonas donghuensis]|uniref:DUF262 domain-containing protein n=1 Tax=Pseudomonas donghuensis TaxID=1163398 RepID=UPI000C2A4438|nr:DUF262 domain-containing protein [Pseudomonas donghuensis]PJY93810.1 hypothetical protein COO64_24020 [Pseudomonas donghuensis]WKY30267.1 DUF262 domain-containing protein [Pseudomonas donghuensis]